MHLILTGFMGVGKSTAGRLLAAQLHRPFIDLDDTIVEHTGQSIAALFATAGAEAFREIESDVLARVLLKPPAVIATGGGTILDPRNVARMNEVGWVVCLDACLATIEQRLQKASDHERPLLHTMHELWPERQSAYAALPNHVATEGATPDEVAQRVAEQFRSHDAKS